MLRSPNQSHVGKISGNSGPFMMFRGAPPSMGTIQNSARSEVESIPTFRPSFENFDAKSSIRVERCREIVSCGYGRGGAPGGEDNIGANVEPSGCETVTASVFASGEMAALVPRASTFSAS